LLVPVQKSPQDAVAWEALRLSGADGLAVRASKKLRGDELLPPGFAGTRLRMELDRIPLWRGEHVAVKQLAEDFARYIYLPRLKAPAVLLEAVRDGVALLSWDQEGFAFADSFDGSAGRYRGLRGGVLIALADVDAPGLLVRPEVARKQLAADAAPRPEPVDGKKTSGDGETSTDKGNVQPDPPKPGPKPPAPPKRFHGTVTLDASRVGRDASQIADEVIAHLVGLVGARVTVTLEVEAEMPSGAPENVVRIVTENGRTLKFTSQGFEKE
jgi:hypothetical protein